MRLSRAVHAVVAGVAAAALTATAVSPAAAETPEENRNRVEAVETVNEWFQVALREAFRRDVPLTRVLTNRSAARAAGFTELLRGDERRWNSLKRTRPAAGVTRFEFRHDNGWSGCVLFAARGKASVASSGECGIEGAQWEDPIAAVRAQLVITIARSASPGAVQLPASSVTRAAREVPGASFNARTRVLTVRGPAATLRFDVSPTGVLVQRYPTR